jgi:predicted component of viral defense system (DUF524 family)
MNKLAAITFEISNKSRLTISQDLNHLNSSCTVTLDNLHWDSQLTIKGALNPSGIIKHDMVEVNNLSRISLLEEHKYYVFIESTSSFTTDPFINSFMNSVITWFPSDFFSLNTNYNFKLIGELKTKAQVGIWDFSTDNIPDLLIHVISTKLDFDTEYSTLVTDISEKIIELTTRFGNINKLPYTESRDTVDSLFLESIHLQNSINEFLESLDLVLSFPYIKSTKKIDLVPIGAQREIDVNHLISSPQSYDWINGGTFSGKFKGFSPLNINTIRREISYDNYPNQFVKYVIDYFLDILYEINSSLNKIHKKSGLDIIRIREVSNWIEEIEMRLHGSFLSNIKSLNYFSSTSQVLEKRIGYQNITKIFDKLQTALHIDFDSSIEFNDKYYSKPVSDLYEIWCFLQIETILAQYLGKPTDQSIINTTNTRIKVTLKQGVKSSIKYSLPYNKDITLFYNYEFSGTQSFTIPYKPDITIEISTPERIIYHHFDSKYKISMDGISFKEEDIWKMHAYKDGILNSMSSSILYPGTQLNYFHKEDMTLINAIPLKPGNKDHYNELQKFILFLINT